MDEDYLLRWTNSEQGGKFLNWNNYFIEITDTINSTMESTQTIKKYKGQWR